MAGTTERRASARWALVVAASAAPLCGGDRAAVAADVETRWNGPVTGQWEDAARWSGGAPVGTAPPGTTYAAIIDAAGAPYTVQVNPSSNAKANSLTLDSADAILRLESGVLDVNRLVVRRGEILTSGLNVIRNATIEYTPGAVFGGNVALENVSFATDVTFTGGSTAFPTGLNTGGRTLTFRHVRGETHLFPFGTNTHISGGGAIVSDAELGFESMHVVAPGGSLTIDPGVELRTGSGHIHLGPASHGSTDSVLNRGTLRAGVADGFARTVELTNVTNQGVIATDRGRIVAFNLANAADLRLAGRDAVTRSDSTVHKLVNDGAITLTDNARLIVYGLDNRGRIDVTGARLGVYDESFAYGTLPLANTGTINLHDAELELGVGMATDQVDVAFNRTGAKSLIVEGRLDNTGRTMTVSPTNRLFVGGNGRVVGGTISGIAGGLAEPAGEEGAGWGLFDGVTLAVDWTLPASGRSGARIENGLTLADGATIRLGSALTFVPSTAAAHTLGGNGRVVFENDDGALRARDLTIGAGVTVETGAGGGLIGTRPAPRFDRTLLNAGTIRAQGGHTILLAARDATNSGTIEVSGGGSILSGAAVVNVGTVRGSGRIDLESLQSDGLIDVSPGTGVGLITVGGDTTLGDANTLRLEIAGATNDAYDHFAIEGALALGGTLHVELLGGYVPAAGTTFQLLGALDGFSDAFDTLRLPPLPADRAWDTAALNTAGRLAVVPEPASAAAILVVAGGAALSRRRLRR